MRRRPCSLALASALALALGLTPAVAIARPTLSINDGCAYSGGQFALNGNGFEADRPAVVEVMGGVDPLAGTPLSAREVTTDRTGRLSVVLDVPATAGTRPVVRAVRVRARAQPDLGMPEILAATPLNTVARSVAVAPRARSGAAGGSERWSVTGLPEGTRLWAHYRHGGETVARVAVGAARDPCGRLRFELRTLPAGHERAGRWDLWLTARRAFRIPRRGVYVQRRMTVASRGPDARVTFAALRSRLAATDPRLSAPVTNAFAADATRIGVIDLVFSRAGDAPVDFFERVSDRLLALGTGSAPAGEPVVLGDATTWSCTRLTRRFVATTVRADGSLAAGAHAVRTPSCVGRFRIAVPRRVAPGADVVVRVADRWGNGAITPTLCITAPRSAARCRGLAFARAVAIATRRVRASARGLWRVELRIGERRVRTSFDVGDRGAAAKPPPPLLATGDSMMQGIDSFLADELGAAARVRSDVRVGTAISKVSADWPQIAAQQVAAHRPRDVVISIGAADGFPMTAPDAAVASCCGEPWVAEYARRVRAMMQTYAQGRRARVYWLTLPLPRLAARDEISRAVNQAILRAATGARGVQVVRLDRTFTPDGYSDAIRFRGRRVRVREIDGVHLNVAGTAIAARIIARLVRRPR